MTGIDFVGYVAATLTTSAFAPQAWRTWRSRSARDLSLISLLAQCAGNGMWFVFAVGSGTLPLALANGFTFLLVTALVAMKLADRPDAAPVFSGGAVLPPLAAEQR